MVHKTALHAHTFILNLVLDTRSNKMLHSLFNRSKHLRVYFLSESVNCAQINGVLKIDVRNYINGEKAGFGKKREQYLSREGLLQQYKSCEVVFQDATTEGSQSFVNLALLNYLHKSSLVFQYKRCLLFYYRCYYNNLLLTKFNIV